MGWKDTKQQRVIKQPRFYKIFHNWLFIHNKLIYVDRLILVRLVHHTEPNRAAYNAYLTFSTCSIEKLCARALKHSNNFNDLRLRVLWTRWNEIIFGIGWLFLLYTWKHLNMTARIPLNDNIHIVLNVWTFKMQFA